MEELTFRGSNEEFVAQNVFVNLHISSSPQVNTQKHFFKALL